MQKQAWTWTTQRLPEPARLRRWGHFGTPVLIFPTAGGDFEEIERFHLITALSELVDGGRIKVYSVDGIAVRAWLGTASPEHCARLQNLHDSFVYEEVVHRIRLDCQDDHIEPILAGAALGAFAAVAGLCRHPDVFRSAVGLSGVYDLAKRLRGVSSAQVAAFSPASYVSSLAGPRLESLRRRSLILGSGEGDYETPDESRRMAEVLASSAIPCRLSLWGPKRDHTWATWREMLPQSLAPLL